MTGIHPVLTSEQRGGVIFSTNGAGILQVPEHMQAPGGQHAQGGQVRWSKQVPPASPVECSYKIWTQLVEQILEVSEQ